MPNFTWKIKYLERYVSDVIEQLQPQYNDEEEIEALTTLISSYVKRMFVTQLQDWKPPLTMSSEDVPEVYPNDHIDFFPIFKKLENIVELDIVYTVNKLNENFNWHKLMVSVDDCKRLGMAVLQLKFIKILRVHNSRIEDLHVQALLQQLQRNRTITGTCQ